jgi:multiple sugar transport system permease protein
MKNDAMLPNPSITFGQILLIAVLLIGAIGMLLPFWVMGVTSFLNNSEIFQYPPKLWPAILHWENYQRLFESAPMGRYLWNSLFVTSLTTVFHVLFSAMAGYAFSRMQFPAKNILFLICLITMMVPPQVNIVPLFFLMKTFGWLDTYWALIVPGLFGAFGVFMLRQWFNALPVDLEDAATMDGCNPWQTFWHIALPLAKPALASLSIFVFINAWNSFMWPLLAVNSPDLMTLPVGIATLKSSFRDATDWSVLMAASTLSTLPVIAVFLFGQRYFIQGILSGSVKE